jgi:hypothetical protein
VTVSTKQGVWRPYEEAPILTPAMARGPEHAHPQDIDALSAYLDALVTHRAAPVHANVAFNAAYFGYDLAQGGYVGGPLELDEFPTVKHEEQMDALPVGALVALATGSTPLFGEVVYREGAHPAVRDDGSVPPWLSGAPAGAAAPPPASGGSAVDGSVTRHELVVLDFEAFTPQLAPTMAQLDRLRTKSRYLDANGHVGVRAAYHSSALAGTSEAVQYQRYLLTRGRSQLL